MIISPVISGAIITITILIIIFFNFICAAMASIGMVIFGAIL